MKSICSAAVAAAKWEKRGRIFTPPHSLRWMKTHAAIPFVIDRGRGRFRAYFAGRDEHNQAQTGFFEFDIAEPANILRVSNEPVLRPGDLGTFDENGAMISWIVNRGDRMHMYYTGWNRGVTVPFRTAIGLAISTDGGDTFRKYGSGPVFDRGIHDPCLLASPCVLIDDGIWRMWYVSCICWDRVDGKPRHHYHVQYAESQDGIHWASDGRVCIGFENPGEYAIARPAVYRENGIYRMWYSYRGARYRIGYAESYDGFTWERRDKGVGIDVSESGWDSEMIAYAFVFGHEGRQYMLYNGNGYGRSGIGLAARTR